MILNAIKEYNIEIKSSYFVGDTWRDVGLCKNTNMTSILMDRGFYDNMKNDFLQKNLTPDHIIKSFAELKDIIK